MQTKIPFSHDYNEELDAEVASFDPLQLLAFIIKETGMHEYAKEGPIEIAITADGASLGNGIGHVTIGYKVVDKRATLPRRDKTPGFQSVYLCYPIMTIIGKESAQLFRKGFGFIYTFLTKISVTGFLGYKPVKVVGPHDGKATNTVLSRGGGAKFAEFFCPYCVCSSEELMPVVSPKCCDCSTRQNNLCRHWQVTDEDAVTRTKNHLASIRPDLADMTQEVYFLKKTLCPYLLPIAS